MIVDLVILGLIHRRAMHGYDLKKQIEVEMQNVDIKFGSIYHALNKLQNAGYLTEAVLEPGVPGKPPRKGYIITPAGAGHFLALLRRALTDSQVPLDGPLHFFYALPPAEVTALLGRRREQLSEEQARLSKSQALRTSEVIRASEESRLQLSETEQQMLTSAGSMIPFLVRQGIKHQVALLEAECRWLDELINELNNPERRR